MMGTKTYLFILILLALACSCAEDSQVSPSSTTVSGSYAKMLSTGNNLYIANESELTTYSITERANPVEINRQQLDFGLESIFIREDLMFIGSTSQMYIYRIATTGIPELLSTTDYANWGNGFFCFRDPIVTNNSNAFVTISSAITSDGTCPRTFEVNELRVYDITTLESPYLITSVEMDEPKGLALDGNWLFVCEKEDGLKVFDVTDPSRIIQINHFPGFSAFDVIPLDGLLLVVGPENLYQYDYKEMSTMTLLSKIDL